VYPHLKEPETGFPVNDYAKMSHDHKTEQLFFLKVALTINAFHKFELSLVPYRKWKSPHFITFKTGLAGRHLHSDENTDKNLIFNIEKNSIFFVKNKNKTN
jgi:hypothetical protein